MKQLGTIEGLMYIQASNRSPIMTIEGNKKKALEEQLKDVLESNLKMVLTTLPRWKKLEPNQVLITPSSGNLYGTGSVSDIAPHTKKVRITIEIEE